MRLCGMGVVVEWGWMCVCVVYVWCGVKWKGYVGGKGESGEGNDVVE